MMRRIAIAVFVFVLVGTVGADCTSGNNTLPEGCQQCKYPSGKGEITQTCKNGTWEEERCFIGGCCQTDCFVTGECETWYN
ncbi:hypothetical protein AAVH_22572 [Aphelenchoides avenae]|nr:hypothetical protein AAVH_22572 [Aphelenchus avenae]